ncbi:olfactory receptor 6F1-like [Dendropsophus ebraccatus]|uniref:olfactory receptor 6F1-like n=1 Tax=Dendropsophus ebraccatus TaxID=150705 RepID=UPI003831BC91
MTRKKRGETSNMAGGRDESSGQSLETSSRGTLSKVWDTFIAPPQKTSNTVGPINNLTVAINFILLGFQGGQTLRMFLFCLLLVVYFGTIFGNLLIIILVSTSKILHTPMYFFISQLSISDILLTSNIAPKMLHIILNNGGSITFIDCITQFYFFGAIEAFECFLLTVMSYDRYVAICNPLRYSSVITSASCVKLASICWVLGFSLVLVYTISTSMLKFCEPYVIDHFFCDYVPLLENACSDTSMVQIEIYLLSIPLVIIPSCIIIVSYGKVIGTILRIPTSTGRQKAFSTCSSHLIVVSIFYWTIFSVYVFPTKGQTLIISKILSLLYTVYTPLINPMIYSLRNKDIRKALQETNKKCLTIHQLSDVIRSESGFLATNDEQTVKYSNFRYSFEYLSDIRLFDRIFDPIKVSGNIDYGY